MNQIYLFIIVILTSFYSSAQGIAIGDWRVHTPYNSGIGIIEHNNEVYFGGEFGFFKVNLNTNEKVKLSKVDGLSDNGFSTLGYHQKEGVVVIGYINGNIDLIKDGTVINISSAKQAQNILGSKRINHVEEFGDYIFVSTDFGVLKIDVVNPGIKETYKNITSGGDILRVNESLVNSNKDSIYLATNIGVMSASLVQSNLIDFNEWTLYDSTNFISEEEIFHLNEFNNTIFAVSDPGYLFKKTANDWLLINTPVNPNNRVFNLWETDNKLYISKLETIYEIDIDGNPIDTITDPIFQKPQLIFIDSQGNKYVSDFDIGSFKQNSDGSYDFFNPNGPFTEDAFNIEYADNQMYVASGGYAGATMQLTFNERGYFTYNYDDGWRSFPTDLWDEIGRARDIVDVAYHTTRKETYFASYSHGLVLLDENGEYQVFYDSSLVTTADPPFISPLTKSFVRARVVAVETDRLGNVWLANHLALNSPQVFRINEDGTWTNFIIPNTEANVLRHLTFDLDNNLWATSRNALFAMTSDDGELQKTFTTSDLFAIPTYTEVDRTGDVWVGTQSGIVIIKNENEMEDFQIERPIIDGRFLLENKIVSSIAVDGANRKWIATDDGVWVFSADGTEQIHHFTAENSPLLSNRVQDLEIDPTTGEIFIATDLGVISYRGESTEPNVTVDENGKVIPVTTCADNIKVFPNPTPPDFEGFIGINGLPENALVKITDISGNLIHESNAFGSQAVWDTMDLNGNKAKTGVYIAYINSGDAENTCVTKIAIIE